jgi:hypothetical protein
MDNAKPNERSLPAEGTAWSRRLEEPGALPGAGLTDKEAAWDKLYDRLRETPRRRTLPWLWAAAACLLLALIPAAFFLREKRTTSRSREPKVAIQPKALSKPTQARTYPAPAPKPSTPPPKTLAHSSQLTARRPQLAAHRLQLAACSLQLATHSYFPDTLAHSSQLTAHSLELAAQSYKKQLRVVHINELEPAQPTPSMAGERQRPGRLQVRLTQPETFRPATTYNNDPIDHPIIPLKHTQNP